MKKYTHMELTKVIIFLALLQASFCSTVSKNVSIQISDSISKNCSKQLNEIINDPVLLSQMEDAGSTIPRPSKNIKFENLGDLEKCVNVASKNIKGKYCLGFVSYRNLSSRPAVTLSPMWAICLPEECGTEDTNIVAKAVLSDFLQEVNITFPETFCQTLEETQPDISISAAITIAFLTSLMIVVLVLTLYDVYAIKFSKSRPWFVSGFSIYSNSERVFKISAASSDHLKCLDGLKWISMLWVIIVHQYTVPTTGLIKLTDSFNNWLEHLYSVFIFNGGLCVDTFFTIGGVLLSYGFLKARNKNIAFDFLHFYVHRYIRLTAPYALVVLVCATILRYFGSGPMWPSVISRNQKPCAENWWASLLYIQNYAIPSSQQCLVTAWYIMVDMQLYLISPLALFGLWKYPTLTMIFLFLCCVTSMSLSFTTIWKNKLPAIHVRAWSKLGNDHYHEKYHILTHLRATPWIIGVVLGYFIFQLKQNSTPLKLNKFFVYFMWFLSTGTLIACVLIARIMFPDHKYNIWVNATHAAIVRPVWSLALCWIVFACNHGYGGPINQFLSFSGYQILNKFSYSTYLIHYVLLNVITMQNKDYLSFTNFNMMYYFWGTFVFSTALAIMVVFFVEYPLIAIEKKYFRNVWLVLSEQLVKLLPNKIK